MSQLTTGQYQGLVNQLAQLCVIARGMMLDEMIETIEEAEKLEKIHKPTEDQKKNLADIKKAAIALREFKAVAVDIAAGETETQTPRIITPGSREWN